MTFKTLLTVGGPNRGEGDLCEQVGAHRDSLADVAVSLEHHGIKARRELIVGEADGGRLLTFARSIHADLIVPSAYGHSCLREWAFGGLTRTLIEEGDVNPFMSYR